MTSPSELALSMLLTSFGLTSGALLPLLMPRPSPSDKLPISLRLKFGSRPDAGSTKRCKSFTDASLRLSGAIG
ncbi:S-adenosylmethionine synthase [Pseudomonas syringae pv. spinaceae]|uniref:S-adenosylmethionine synthase n=1 Tax=Pseudomonas syringae pv. spinaceae TaxID=264459 RepID=A0A0N8T4L1_PSESX|nr:S-adenosylmethionine synthase [Pseudomonas syringae pv. spinaceae]